MSLCGLFTSGSECCVSFCGYLKSLCCSFVLLCCHFGPFVFIRQRTNYLTEADSGMEIPEEPLPTLAAPRFWLCAGRG